METPSIESGRLRLRGWRREDFDPFAALRGSPEDQAYTGGPVSRERAWTEFCAKAGEWTVQDLGPLMSFVHPDNQASRAVAERLGAVVEGQGRLNGEPRLIYRHAGPEKAKG
tara:strand:- start:175 stop:510 length:336 start_codon:yes stop_codon:yes gene_type:complete